MANQEQYDRLKQGASVWNPWRSENWRVTRPDLRGANLSNEDLREINLHEADLRQANLSEANLDEADLSEADLTGANLTRTELYKANLAGANLHSADLKEAFLFGASLHQANLTSADLSWTNLSEASLYEADLQRAVLKEAILHRAFLNRAKLSEADLYQAVFSEADLSRADLCRAILRMTNLLKANLSEADLCGADLSLANLSRAILVRTNLAQATLTGCSVFGISAWDLRGTPEDQSNLIITPDGESRITVDDLEVAQFIYLFLNNEKIRQVIDTVTSKVVLILGRFTCERKPVLDALREKLREEKYRYVPVVFDFDKPTSKTTTETVELLARMARFVIADLTDAKSVLQELRGIVPVNPSLPVRPLLLSSQEEPGMFDFFKAYKGWFLEVFRYKSQAALLSAIEEVVAPAEEKVKELRPS